VWKEGRAIRTWSYKRGTKKKRKGRGGGGGQGGIERWTGNIPHTNWTAESTKKKEGETAMPIILRDQNTKKRGRIKVEGKGG